MDDLQFGILHLRTVLILVHLVGLMLGMGCTILLDTYILRRIYTHRLETHDLHLVSFGSGLVMLGIGLLWVSGLGFLLDYAAVAPEKLGNPKIWSKLFIVSMLTINGLFLHKIVFPRFAARVGQRAFAEVQTSGESVLFLLAGLVSSVSWAAAFVLGAIKELNNIVAWDVIVLTYVAVLGSAGAVVLVGHAFLVDFQHRRLPRLYAEPRQS